MLDTTSLCPTSQNQTLVGIDEAGRGALAGPLVVAGVLLQQPIKGLKDSKKLSKNKREELFEQIKTSNSHEIVIIPNDEIDTKGLSTCMKKALCQIVQKLEAQSYLFDGNTSFGCDRLQTLIKADDKIQEVMAASILAKVTRDNLMRVEAKNYPKYGFENHVGYGTKAHVEAISKYGHCKLHRKSFKVKTLIKSQGTLF